MVGRVGVDREEGQVAISQLLQPRAFRYAEEVARRGSIRRAAESLNIASSAVNRMILELERALGAQLFERLPRGVRLTSAGEFLLLHIRRSNVEFETVRTQIDGLKGVQRGHVTVASVEAAIQPFLAHTLAQFHLSHRRIAARLLALATAPYHLHAFVGRYHPLARRHTVRLADCTGYPVAMGDETLGGRQRLEIAFEHASLDFRPVLASNSVALMTETAKYSDVICFQALPVERRRTIGPLVAIPLADPGVAKVELALIANRRRTLSTAAATLAARLSQAIRQNNVGVL
jgi:DNA-binding transcriptional LysR family regulator